MSKDYSIVPYYGNFEYPDQMKSHVLLFKLDEAEL